MVIVVLSRREIGQPALAASVALSHAALSAFGTLPLTDKWIPVTVQPASTFSMVTAAVVANRSAVRFAAPNCPDSAIVKQPAWAAAISSSGFVPFPFSNLVLNEYCDCASTPLSVDTVPFPVFRSPCHCAEALRFISSSNHENYMVNTARNLTLP